MIEDIKMLFKKTWLKFIITFCIILYTISLIFLILNYYKILDSFYYYTVFGIASVLMIIYNILVSINNEKDYEKKIKEEKTKKQIL